MINWKDYIFNVQHVGTVAVPAWSEKQARFFLANQIKQATDWHLPFTLIKTTRPFESDNALFERCAERQRTINISNISNHITQMKNSKHSMLKENK